MRKYFINFVLLLFIIANLYSQEAAWESVTNSGTQNGKYVCCFGQTVYILDGNSLRVSTDWGKTWEDPRPLGFSALAMYFLNSQVGWAIEGTSPAGLYKTINGGLSWLKVFTFPITLAGITSKQIQFLDENNGYIDPHYFLYKTTDGGLSFGENIHAESAQSAFYFVNISTGWFVGQWAGIYKTTNAGGNLNQQTNNCYMDNRSNYKTIHGNNTSTLYAAGNRPDGKIAKTSNGGNSWQCLSTNETGTIWNRIWAFPSNNIWLLGDIQGISGIISSSNDGANWIKYDLPIPDGAVINDFYMTNKDSGWAVGSQGTVMRLPGNPPAITINGIEFEEICAGQTDSIYFSFSDIFDIDNLFFVELSDENGDFTDPDTIGVSINFPKIKCRIPKGAMSSDMYKIRIVSTVPEEISNEIDITIHAIPEVSFDSLANFCFNEPGYTLVEGKPEGGTYFGDGVENGIFSPSVAGAGQDTIYYTYTNFNGCIDTAFAAFEVYSSPSITFSAIPDICVNKPQYILTEGNPQGEGGKYFGDNVVDSIFYPSQAGTGEHIIYYAYTDSNGCSDTVSYTINIIELLEKPDILRQNDTLFSSISATYYQWYFNEEAIDGATDSFWIPNDTGAISVRIFDEDSCSNISDPFEWPVVHVKDDYNLQADLSVNPNPFNGNTDIYFSLNNNMKMSLFITNLLGNKVKWILHDNLIEKGQHIIKLDAVGLQPGLYFCTLKSDKFIITVKMIVMR
ncbi:T9SS type A sorting domain-containing protein [Bacteroidota bacterium]